MTITTADEGALFSLLNLLPDLYAHVDSCKNCIKCHISVTENEQPKMNNADFLKQVFAKQLKKAPLKPSTKERGNCEKGLVAEQLQR